MAEPGPVGRVLGGRYRLRSRLGAGGMGTVWAAEDLVLGREVAVKVLGEALAADRTAALRLRREARAAGRLVHPAIARVLDLGEDGGHPYLVMELLHGESLAARLARAGPLAPAEAARVVAATADGLEVAHRAGIVHRDVKPGNVFVTSAGEVKLLDFGIASAAGEAALTGGDLLGTAAYLAPERVAGDQATPATDVYALGVLLYELLAGRPPFAGDTGTALALAHLHAHPAPLRAVAPQVPPALAAACERALAKDPAARPPSAAALAALLRSTVATATAGSPAAAHALAPALSASTPFHRPAATVGTGAHPVAGATTPVRESAPGMGVLTAGHRPAATVGAATPVHRPSAVGARGNRGAASTARRGARVAALVLLAALLAAVPSLGLLDGGEPARPGGDPAPGGRQAPAGRQAPGGGQAAAGGQAPAGGQTPAGGRIPAGASDPAAGRVPGGAADPLERAGGDQAGEDGGGGGSGGSGGGGGDGGSSGPG